MQSVLLSGISWTTYERLLVEHEESSGTHFFYDRGKLEIMVLSARYESLKHTLTQLVDVMAEELDIDVYGFGSTTFRRADLARGFEPDACFYIQNEAMIRGKEEIDLSFLRQQMEVSGLFNYAQRNFTYTSIIRPR